MRPLLVIALLALTGCSLFRKDAEAVQPDAATQAASLNKVGQAIDAGSGKVAAAVTVAVQNKDKPAVVEAEGRLALSFLPPPSEGDLAIAKARAAKADQKDYASAEAAGKKAVAELAASLAKAKADQAEAFRVSQLKDKRIEELERQVASADNKLWTIAGIALVVIGGLIWWLLKDAKGAMTIAGMGLMCGAYPQVMGSPWFMYIAIGSVGFCAILAGWWAFDRVRDAVNKR